MIALRERKQPIGTTYWHQIKRIGAGKGKTVNGSIIDGPNDAKDSVQLFTSKYRDLYTSVYYAFSVIVSCIVNSVITCTDRTIKISVADTFRMRIETLLNLRDGPSKACVVASSQITTTHSSDIA